MPAPQLSATHSKPGSRDVAGRDPCDRAARSAARRPRHHDANEPGIGAKQPGPRRGRIGSRRAARHPSPTGALVHTKDDRRAHPLGACPEPNHARVANAVDGEHAAAARPWRVGCRPWIAPAALQALALLHHRWRVSTASGAACVAISQGMAEFVHDHEGAVVGDASPVGGCGSPPSVVVEHHDPSLETVPVAEHVERQAHALRRCCGREHDPHVVPVACNALEAASMPGATTNPAAAAGAAPTAAITRVQQVTTSIRIAPCSHAERRDGTGTRVHSMVRWKWIA